MGIVAVSDPAAADFELPEGMAFGDPAKALDAALSALGHTDIVIACIEGSSGWIDVITTQYKGRVSLFLTGDRNDASAKEEYLSDPPRMNVFDRGRFVGLITANPGADSYSFAGMSFGLSEDLADVPAIRAMLDTDFKPHLKDYFGVT